MSEPSFLPKQPTQSIQRIVLQVIVIFLLAFAGLWILYSLRPVLLLLAITGIFCYLLAPLVNLFEKRVQAGPICFRIPRGLAIVLVYIVFFGAIALAFETLIPPLSDQLNGFLQTAPEYLKKLDGYLRELKALPALLRLPAAFRGPLSETLDSATSSVFTWMESIALRTVYATKYLPWLVLIPLIGFFFLRDAHLLSNRLLSTLPRADLRYRATLFLKDVSETLAGYMRGQVLACLIVGLIEGVGLWMLGVSYPVVFAVAAGLFEFIPIIGPFVVGLLAVLVTSVQSPRSALAVFAFLAIFRLIHDYLIYPRLISRGMEIHPVAIILAVLCGVELGGVIGVFLSLPVVALLMVCLRHWRDLQLDRITAPANPDELNRVRRFGTED